VPRQHHANNERSGERDEQMRAGAHTELIHLEPSYLADVRDAVNALFEALQPLTNRALGGYAAVDQPLPDDLPPLPAYGWALVPARFPNMNMASYPSVSQLQQSDETARSEVIENSGESGAGNETRTRDLNLGKVPLYQLSYSRTVSCRGEL
jgi:hypothetical protein